MVKAKKTNDTSSDTGNTDGAPKNGGKRDKWTAPTLAILIRILLDEKKLGRRAESGWTSESYTKVVVALKAAGYARTAKQVKGCWTRVCHVVSRGFGDKQFPFWEGGSSGAEKKLGMEFGFLF
jgi:hypothetical protein